MSRRGRINRTRTVEEAEKLLPRHVSRAALRAQQAARQEQAARLRASERGVKEVLELTAGFPRDSSGTIYGPRGEPLLRPLVEDFTKLSATGPDDQVRLYAEDILKRAARMQRDGASLRQIADALDVESIVPLRMLEAALIKVGHPLLEADIKAGVEPEESRVIVGYEALNPDGTPVDDNEAHDPALHGLPADTRRVGVRPITKRERVH